jgi:hypothetical protein
MRVRKIIAPPTLHDPAYDGFVPRPKDGELVSLPSGEPWSLQVDEGAGLHLLL